MFPLAALILYAVGRSIGIPSAEPRFMHMEVAWGIITLVCALSAGFASENRTAILAGSVAALGLFAFNVASYNATFLMRHSILLRRNEVDREAFQRIQAAAAKYPEAEAILVNDHAGLWSARAMLEDAGFATKNLEVLPTIINAPSTDVLKDLSACPVDTQFLRLPSTLQVRLDYPAGCAVSAFGRDVPCAVNRYRLEGRPHSAAWAEFLLHEENQELFPAPLIHDVPMQPGKPLVLIAWRDRLSVPKVTALPNENGLALDSEVR
jgi:hypothetical protein